MKKSEVFRMAQTFLQAWELDADHKRQQYSCYAVMSACDYMDPGWAEMRKKYYLSHPIVRDYEAGLFVEGLDNSVRPMQVMADIGLTGQKEQDARFMYLELCALVEEDKELEEELQDLTVEFYLGMAMIAPNLVHEDNSYGGTGLFGDGISVRLWGDLDKKKKQEAVDFARGLLQIHPNVRHLFTGRLGYEREHAEDVFLNLDFKLEVRGWAPISRAYEDFI